MNRWLNFIQTLAYPQSCRLCGEATAEASALCPGCLRALPWLGPACRRCAGPLPPGAAGSLCGACLQRPPPFDATYSAWRYGAPVDALLQRLKYQGDLALARTLALAWLPVAAQRAEPWPQALVPVPLHPRRLRARGFNQALEFARPLARALGVPVLAEACRRTRDTPSQSALSRAQRRANVRGAFRIVRPPALERLAIVDDVLTTGATVRELARVLRGAGVRRIEVWTCARAV